MGGRIIDETNKRYGQLFVIRLIKKRHHNKEAQWLCRCDCGNETIVTGYRLRTNHTRSCGCLVKYPEGEAAFNTLWSLYKHEAKNRKKVSWRLTKPEFRKLVDSDCYYCGVEPKQKIEQKQWNGGYIYNGVDRLDSNKGYEVDNVVPCCGECNMSKRTRTEKEFRTWVRKVYEHLNLSDVPNGE